MTSRYFLFAALACLIFTTQIDARGFGGFAAGGFNAGGFRAGGFEAGGYRFGEAGGFHTDSFSGMGGRYNYSGERTTAGAEGWRGGAAGTSYDRNLSGPRGGDVNVDGARGAASGPFGGGIAGGTRDVTATGPNGRSYTNDRAGGVAVGPYGRAVGGAEGTRTFAGAAGAGAEGWRSAFGNYRMPTDLGHFSAFSGAAVGRSTAYWSSGTMAVRGGAVRTGFPYYGAFRPGWYATHPAAWIPGGWVGNAAWLPVGWPALTTWVGVGVEPLYYDFGNAIVYQDNVVYQDGVEIGTAVEYAQQATNLADAGQAAAPPATQQWKALGVFALVSGDEQTSNNVFQLAIDQNGVVRGNYYDGVLDSTTPVYGSLDKKTQRVAWSIGKKNDRIFDTGLANLTKDQAPVLVHLGAGSTVQMLLVRMQDTKDQKQ